MMKSEANLVQETPRSTSGTPVLQRLKMVLLGSNWEMTIGSEECSRSETIVRDTFELFSVDVPANTQSPRMSCDFSKVSKVNAHVWLKKRFVSAAQSCNHSYLRVERIFVALSAGFSTIL